MINFNVTIKFDYQERGYYFEKFENDRKLISKLIYDSEAGALRELDHGHVEWIRWEDA